MNKEFKKLIENEEKYRNIYFSAISKEEKLLLTIKLFETIKNYKTLLDTLTKEVNEMYTEDKYIKITIKENPKLYDKININ